MNEKMCFGRHWPLLLIWVSCYLVCTATCQLFHPTHSITYTTSSKTSDYFGYSVFIQQGDPPKLVVGAPKGEVNQVGSVHVCPIRDGSNECSSYMSMETDTVTEVRNRSMFGGSISGGCSAGDPIMVCAPKFTVSVTLANTENYFTNGACYFLPDIEKGRRHLLHNTQCKHITSKAGSANTYNCAFSEFGFAADFDEDLQEFLVGTPGEFSFTGNAIRVWEDAFLVPPTARQIQKSTSYSNLRKVFNIENGEKSYSYRGYAVTTGKFAPSGNVSYVVGSPRANDLKGEVELISAEARGRGSTFLKGDTFGAYFGSALCALDVNGDGLDELLVGAPNYKHERFDEGAVYFYRNVKGVLQLANIIQSEGKKPGGRFGAAISKLPNVTKENLDGVVISSPNEDGGIGAVYIYLYLDNAWNMHQRIQVEGQRGFGYSLSKAIDVTGDDFNDIAVGSYKSNSAVLLKSRQIFHYGFSVNVSATLYSYKENSPFDIVFCVFLHGVPAVPTQISLIASDSRVNINRTYTDNVDGSFCKSVNVVLNSKVSMTTSLHVRITAQETQSCPSCAISSPSKKNYLVHEIPFLVDCGDDQICNPKLTVASGFDVAEPHVVGSKSSVRLTVDVRNSDEPAYLCKASLGMPSGVSLKTSSPPCERSAENCSLTDIIQHKTSIVFDLNVERFTDIVDYMEFGFSVVCVNYTTSSSFRLGLKYEFELESKGVDNRLVYKNKNVTKSLEFKYGFFVRNKGPSPLKDFPVVFRLPHRILSLGDDAQIFTIFKPEFPSELMKCDGDLPDYSSDQSTAGSNATSPEGIAHAGFVSAAKQDDFRCGGPNTDLECLNVHCKISLNKLQEFKVEFTVRPDIPKLLRIFENTFGLIASFEYTKDQQKFVEDSEIVLEDTISDKGVSWYWILLGVLVGLALLVGLVYLLYKYNFFKRKTREQLVNERQVQEMGLSVREEEEAENKD